MDRERAIINVVSLQDIFKKSFAVYGTALGSLREDNIIEHDLDTDIGIFEEDFNLVDLNEAVRNGFNISYIFGMRHYGMEIAFSRDGIKTDLMLFYKNKENGRRFNCLWQNGGKNGLSDVIMHKYDETLFQVQYGHLGIFLIRTLGEDYIKRVYGDDWRIPVKKWDWRCDHQCIKK